MKRILIIGCPGSGKSTLARALAEKTALPLCHLDLLYWNPDRTTVDKETFYARLAAVLDTDAWIIDGNYMSTMEWRIKAADTVIFLDYPTDVCLDGVRARRGALRSDMPWTETEEDAEFIRFIKDFSTATRPGILALLERYGDRRILTFTSRDEAEAFLVKAYPTPEIIQPKETAMNTLEAIYQRKSTRAYTSEPVPEEAPKEHTISVNRI